jgi:hypothetical protein
MCYGYIYVRKHESYENSCKLGKTINIPDRDTQYATGELKRGLFVNVYQISIKKMDIIERLLQYEFKKYHVYYDAGIEFYDIEILNLIEPYFNTLNMEYKKLTMDEIDKLHRLSKIIKTLRKLKFNKIVKTKLFYVRDYQKKIIQFSKDEIEKNKKIYIELPTGGGKSFIVYNLFKELKSNFILIISPRKIINNQNVSDKYLKILKERYAIFNYSNDTNIENFLNIKGKKIIVCCTQSINKIYDYLKNIQNITIWFDEAHWCIEEYVKFLNNDKIFFWLKNTTNIIHRIFTSASPNKSIVLNNIDIFGMLYKEISVRNLYSSKLKNRLKD